jgi:hypothetical protein
MHRYYLTLLLSFCFLYINAQVKRSFLYKGTSIDFLAQNNRLQNDFSFPGIKSFIIIGNSSKSLIEIYTADKLRKFPISGMNDYACFYYLKHTYFLNDTMITDFLKGFIKQNYESDYIDRNSVNLVWQTNNDSIPYYVFTKNDTIINSKSILNDSDKISDRTYNFSTPEQIWIKSKSSAINKRYHVPSLLEMEEKESEKLRKKELNKMNDKNGNIYFQFTNGLHYINKEYKTDIDSSMALDFTKYKTIWNINIGYSFTPRLFTTIDFAFIYTGEQKKINGITFNNNDGITVNGSGYGGAMIRYGLGMGWLPYSRNRLDILFILTAGQLTARSGGGTVARTIGGSGNSNSTEINQKKEQTNYYNLSTGINYRFNSSFYFTGNIQYNLSKLKQPIGSVNAFTGLSINGGFGFTIPSKKKNN